MDPAPPTTQVVPTEEFRPSALSPLDLPVSTFSSALKRRGDNRRALMDWVKSALVEGVDFSRIHVAKGCPHRYDCDNPNHYSRNSLRKPGAEKICGMLGVLPLFPALADYEKACLEGTDIRIIMLRCTLIGPDGETIVAEGSGARNVDQDSGDLNKALKMAMKSAQIDATLRMAGLSEIFTQDLEDLHLEESEDPRPPQYRDQPIATQPVTVEREAPRGAAQASAPRPAPPPAQGSPQHPGQRPIVYATEKQIGMIIDMAIKRQIRPEEIWTAMGIRALAELPKGKVDECLTWIRAYQPKPFETELPQ